MIIGEIFRKLLLAFFVFLFSFATAISQGSAGDAAIYESRAIVVKPNAGILPKGAYSFRGGAFGQGGAFLGFDASPFANAEIGLTFGGTNVIGSRAPVWQKAPGVRLKIRIFDETKSFPAVAIGFDSQGYGEYLKNLDRFLNLSPGFFLAFSKNYSWPLGQVSFHLCANYSIELAPKDRKPDLTFGLEQSLGSRSSLNLEYDLGLDNSNPAIAGKNGFLNAAFRFSLSEGLTAEFRIADILKNFANQKGFNRSILFEYSSFF